MKMMKAPIFLSGAAMVLILGYAHFPASAQIRQETGEQAAVRMFTAVSLDDAPVPAYDFQRANRLPLTGYFEKSFEVNGIIRTAGFYIAATAPVRSFFTVLTVPEGYPATDFLVASGWLDLADKNDEGLVLLEPGPEGWGDPETELDYISAVMEFYGRNDYFSIFGISYLVGYEGGGSALEAWAAAHPLLVVSQAYVNTDSMGGDFYARFDTIYMNGLLSGYTPVEIPGDIRIAYSEVPVPTAFIHRDRQHISNGLSYWKKVNDVVDDGLSDPGYLMGAEVFSQSADSDAWATAYSGPISRVAVLQADADATDPHLTGALYGFLTRFVSYDNTTAYGNHLAPRKAYGEIRTMLVEGELREFQVYVPAAAKSRWPDGAPVVFIFAGNSQTDKVFFHNTLWWKVADREGCILVIPCETYSRTSTTVSHANTGEFYVKLARYVADHYPADPSRFYATGQSAGSFAVQEFGITHPEYFAAIASTSGLSFPSDEGGFGRISREDATYSMIPDYCIIGEGDIEMMTGTLWDGTENMLDGWAAYYLEANDAGPLGDGSNLQTDGRFQTWTWNNSQGFPVFKVGRTLYRAHNCIPAEMPLLWDFLKHWSCRDGLRYYDGIQVER